MASRHRGEITPESAPAPVQQPVSVQGAPTAPAVTPKKKAKRAKKAKK